MDRLSRSAEGQRTYLRFTGKLSVNSHEVDRGEMVTQIRDPALCFHLFFASRAPSVPQGQRNASSVPVPSANTDLNI
jgi:hypothetical protein